MKTYLAYLSVLNANLELHLQQMGMEFGGGCFVGWDFALFALVFSFQN